MSFLNPAGLWLLLGIPLLIFLYIIKQKYTSRILGSSFIWRKSQPLIKKNIRIRKLLRYLLFILQLLIIAFAAFMLARPVPTSQMVSTNYYIILDSSGSMRAELNGKSRFDRALDKAADLTSTIVNGSTMSIICAGDEASFAVKNTESEVILRRALKNVKCGYSGADIAGALSLIIQEQSGAKPANIILYTDTDYTDTGDIQVVNLANDEFNSAIMSLTADSGTKGYSLTGTVASYGKSTTETVSLYLDGTFKDAQLVDLENGVPAQVTFNIAGTEAFTQAKLSIDTDDSIADDNQYLLVNDSGASKNILLVSDYPLFITKALGVSGDFNIKTTKTLDKIPSPTEDESFLTKISGYDLYIFDGIIPDILPEDGAVWLLNPKALPQDPGPELGNSGSVSEVTPLVNNNSKTYTLLTRNMKFNDIVVSDYKQAADYPGYEAILACSGSPVLLAKESENYIKTVVLMFDIHDSNLPLLPAFPLLIKNMTDYSLPSMLETRDYLTNEPVTIAALPGAVTARVTDEAGNETKLALNSDGSIFTPPNTGLYTVKQFIGGSVLSEKEDSFFVHMLSAESNTHPETESLGLGESSPWYVQTDGLLGLILSLIKKIWPWIIALLLVILLLEWGLYHREEL
jgi:hypothetical protein